jgi:hypothetical protein
MSALLDYADRRNTHNFWREFAQAGADCQAFCARQRQLTRAVPADVEELWQRAPWLPTTAISQRVRARFALATRSAETIRQAATQLDDHPIRRALHQQLARGQVHYREAWLLAELFGAVEPLAEAGGADRRAESARWAQRPQAPALPRKEGTHASIPRAGVWREAAPPEDVSALWQGPLGLTILMALRYIPGVSRSVLGRWCGRHRRRLDRRILRLAQGDWQPLVPERLQGICAGVACVEEQWLQIRGPWWYFCWAQERRGRHPPSRSPSPPAAVSGPCAAGCRPVAVGAHGG